MSPEKLEGREVNLTNEAGEAFLSPEAGRRIWAKELNGTNESLNPGNLEANQQSPKYKNDRRNNNAYEQMAMQSAAGNTSNILTQLGDLLFSGEEVQDAMSEEIEFLESRRETLQKMQEANQDIYLRNEDGSLMSPEEIQDYENQNMMCVADPHQDQADLMQLDADLAAAHEVQQAIEAGEDVDFEQLPPSVQKTLIRDEVASKIEAGEDVDLSSIPPEYRDIAIDAVIDAEQDAQSIALYEEYGYTEQDFRDRLFFDEGHDDLRSRFIDDRYDWRDERRAELEAKAEVNANDPEPEHEPKITEEQELKTTGINSLSL